MSWKLLIYQKTHVLKQIGPLIKMEYLKYPLIKNKKTKQKEEQISRE